MPIRSTLVLLFKINDDTESLGGEQCAAMGTCELGGNDLAIKPFIVKPASATRHIFRDRILNGEAYAGVTVVTPDRRILARLIHERGAIGQLSLAFLKGVKRIGLVSVDGEQATSDNPNYPISRQLYLVTHGEPNTEVKRFLDWTRSNEGQSVVRKRFVGLN
ncbi:MAG: hypothetical protein KZQ95_13765 [Candidatus Thiodiazotropha sp. (ex Epidulcina cf. delphinae)]|nr:hypothetical protein [Candidatus Thiodiazotropha sp. (ex Epidulcina cf. delphinae)]